MKKITWISLLSLLLGMTFVSCSSEAIENNVDVTTDANIEKIDSIDINLTKCDCLEPKEKYVHLCETRFKKEFTAQEKFECTGDSSYIDTIQKAVGEEEREAYEEDLSLEIKEIEEEKEDPISEECKLFLEEYAEAIKDFKSLSDRMDANPEDIGLKISYKSQSEDMESWSSKPQMFKCSQNEAFKKQVEILNEKKEKLLNGE